MTTTAESSSARARLITGSSAGATQRHRARLEADAFPPRIISRPIDDVDARWRRAVGQVERGGGREDHAARVRMPIAAGLHPGTLRPPPLAGNGSLRPPPRPST